MVKASLFIACSLAPLALAVEAPVPARIQYNRDVRPILADACFRCHGFDKNKREADRRLDTREGALAEQDGVKAIVPGKLAESDAHVRIHSTDKEEILYHDLDFQAVENFRRIWPFFRDRRTC